MTEDRYFAHSRPGCPPSGWELLDGHLRTVADLAAEFAAPFGSADWARLAGLWHDLGKYSPAFQEYLLASAVPEIPGDESDTHRAEVIGKVDHTSAGAQHAARCCPVIGHLLAHAIAGHHSGLLDARAAGACLEARLQKAVSPWQHAPQTILFPPECERIVPLPPALDRTLSRRHGFGVAFFTRMVFSCLVDADFLATEQFVAPERAEERPRWPDDILVRIEDRLSARVAQLEATAVRSEVNLARGDIRDACLRAAEHPPGFFTLTVPTGGGKTLASLAFALAHARRFGLRRVLYVIPFTSIIEQNARVFREVTDPLVSDGCDDPVIEHHSNLGEEQESNRSRLAAENWDAPLVVTTAVQFFESLFASRSSRCRKLHNIARAVVILDEAQTLPVDILHPCLAALKELVDGYGTSVVLCTATQPALATRERFPIGIENAREIVPDPSALYRRLRRVDVVDLGRLTDEQLLARLEVERRVLCIVNTRRHARTLTELWAARGSTPIHLSALMCPAHRSERLDEIRTRLRSGDVCQVISTQLVEAGVDVDFPVVYRSLAGIDAIAQAAGRCNREGTLARGRAFVFRPEHVRSEAYFRDTACVAAQVLELHNDPLSLEAVDRYFRLYYWEQEQRWDRHGILRLFELDSRPDLPFLFGFATAAERFRVIEETNCPVIVPWQEEGRRLCNGLRYGPGLPSRRLLRALQRYTVSIPKPAWDLEAGRTFELVHGRFPVLFSPELHYSRLYGLATQGSAGEALIA